MNSSHADGVTITLIKCAYYFVEMAGRCATILNSALMQLTSDYVASFGICCKWHLIWTRLSLSQKPTSLWLSDVLSVMFYTESQQYSCHLWLMIMFG